MFIFLSPSLPMTTKIVLFRHHFDLCDEQSWRFPAHARPDVWLSLWPNTHWKMVRFLTPVCVWKCIFIPLYVMTKRLDTHTRHKQIVSHSICVRMWDSHFGRTTCHTSHECRLWSDLSPLSRYLFIYYLDYYLCKRPASLISLKREQ